PRVLGVRADVVRASDPAVERVEPTDLVAGERRFAPVRAPEDRGDRGTRHDPAAVVQQVRARTGVPVTLASWRNEAVWAGRLERRPGRGRRDGHDECEDRQRPDQSQSLHLKTPLTVDCAWD